MPSDYDPPRRRSRDDDDRDEDDDRPRRRRRDEDDDDDRPRRRRREYDDRPQKASNGLAVAALILGVLSLCTSFLTGIPAVICGMLAMGKPTGRGLAITGMLLGLLGTIAGGVGGYFLYEQSKSRNNDTNNMRQIALAFHNQHDSLGGMSGPYLVNRGEVNTGLSWRVGLLPYVEQDSLYGRFKVDEPWDGPTNKSLSNTPVRVYSSPYDGKASTNTPYRVFYGGGALFNEDGKPVRITEILDGTSVTIMAVHANEQVPWAASREFKYDPNGSLPKFGHSSQSGGFHAALADGSVRFIRKDVSESTLRLLITKADGMPLPLDW